MLADNGRGPTRRLGQTHMVQYPERAESLKKNLCVESGEFIFPLLTLLSLSESIDRIHLRYLLQQLAWMLIAFGLCCV